MYLIEYTSWFEQIESSLPDILWGYDDLDSYQVEKPLAYLVVPTCSCDYIKWVVKDNDFRFPYLGNELCPTKQVDDQCQYCGHYVHWARVDVKNFESKSLPTWADENYFSKVLEKTWFTQYYEAMERVKRNRSLDEVTSQTDN